VLRGYGASLCKTGPGYKTQTDATSRIRCRIPVTICSGGRNVTFECNWKFSLFYKVSVNI